MSIGLFLLSWSPVVLLAVLAVFLRRSALELSLYGFLFSLLLAIGIFKTSISVALLSAVDGVLTTLPLLFVILGGIFLSSILMDTGALKRIVEWFKGGVGDAFGRNVLIIFGVANFMEGAGVIAEPVAAPMLAAAGVSPSGAAALSIIGYSGLMTLEMAGIIVTVLALVTGLPVAELGVTAAWLSIPATLAMAFCVPHFLPQGAWEIRRLFVILSIALVAGVTGLGAAAFVGVPVAGILAGLAVIFAFILLGSGRLRLQERIFADLAPFAFLLVCLLSVNVVPFVRVLTFERFAVKVNFIPVHTITFRPLFSAYLYLFLAFLISIRLQGVSAKEIKTIIRNGFQRSWRVFVAMGTFGAMGQMITYTGYHAGFAGLDTGHNIPWIISQGLAGYTGECYPLFVPMLGWVGTFLTGYGVASLMLFGQLQVQAASILGVSAIWLSAGLAVGSSVGSISSPFKVTLAASMCGAVGREGDVLRRTIPMGLAASLLVGGVLWMII